MWLTLIYIAVGVLLVWTILEVLYYKLRVDFNTEKEQTMDELAIPSLAGLYFCAVMQAIHFRPGKFYPALPGEKMTKIDPDSPEGQAGIIAQLIPPESETAYALAIYMKHDYLRWYRNSIGYSGERRKLPPLVLSAYFNKALIALGSSQYARARVLGTIHYRHQVTIYEDVSRLMHEYFWATFRNEKYMQTVRGIEGIARGCVYDREDNLVWEHTYTGVNLKSTGKRSKSHKSSKLYDMMIYREQEIVAPADTGMKFAKCTQDYQPQHLNKWTARMIGFSKPIAHGLWSMAVAVDRIMFNEKQSLADRYPLQMDVHFKRPLVLPGKALLQYEQPASDYSSLTKFRMVEPNTLAPILVGKMWIGEKQDD